MLARAEQMALFALSRAIRNSTMGHSPLDWGAASVFLDADRPPVGAGMSRVRFGR